MRRIAPTAFVCLAGILALACNPRVGEYEERGDRYAAQGEYVDARVEYELALEAAGDGAPDEIWMKAGALALRSKDFNRANRIFDRLVADEPDLRDEVMALYHLHAHRWVDTGDTFSALEAIDWIRDRDSTANLGALYYTLGDAAYARPDYDAAVEAYLLGLARAEELAPAETYARLGDAHERKRSCAAAIEAFRIYLGDATEESEEKPLAGDARYRLGTCAWRMAERSFAAEDYDRAAGYLSLVQQTGEPVSRLDDAALMRARIFEREGNREAAMDRYREIVDRNRGKSSRPAVEAFRRLKQLEFGLPLQTAERMAEEREREGRRQERSGGTR